jgi:hypothetical protein
MNKKMEKGHDAVFKEDFKNQRVSKEIWMRKRMISYMGS